jgi:hypothetical protein
MGRSRLLCSCADTEHFGQAAYEVSLRGDFSAEPVQFRALPL